MKKTLLFFTLGSFAMSANAQMYKNHPAKPVKESEVNRTVQESFKKLQPNAKVEKWEQQYVNYEAEFKDANGIENSIWFGPNGQVLQTEIEIKAAELPKTVSDYCSKNMPGKTIAGASKITDAKGKVTYEVEVDGTDYVIDGSGNLLEKENGKDDEK